MAALLRMPPSLAGRRPSTQVVDVVEHVLDHLMALLRSISASSMSTTVDCTRGVRSTASAILDEGPVSRPAWFCP